MESKVIAEALSSVGVVASMLDIRTIRTFSTRADCGYDGRKDELVYMACV
jgi:hypothetical protein